METACLGIRLLFFGNATQHSCNHLGLNSAQEISRKQVRNVKCTESVMSKLSPNQKPKQDYIGVVEAVPVEGEIAGLEKTTLQSKLHTMYFSALTNSALSSTDSDLP